MTYHDENKKPIFLSSSSRVVLKISRSRERNGRTDGRTDVRTGIRITRKHNAAGATFCRLRHTNYNFVIFCVGTNRRIVHRNITVTSTHSAYRNCCMFNFLIVSLFLFYHSGSLNFLLYFGASLFLGWNVIYRY